MIATSEKATMKPPAMAPIGLPRPPTKAAAKIGSRIRILSGLTWPVELEARFLERWRAGHPELPAPPTQPADHAEAIAALARDGVRKVAVVPVFLAQGGHLKRDLPVLLDEARAAHPGCEITLATAAGEADPVVRAMADYAASCLG